MDEVYRDHRSKMFIVANTCVRPFPQCFCVCTDSGPYAARGLRRQPDRPRATPTSSRRAARRATPWLAELGLPPPAGAEAAARKAKTVDASIGRFDAEAIENKAWISRVMNRMTTGFIKHEIWEYIGNQCFECGACSFVCPTCSCFNIEDVATRAGIDRPAADLGLLLLRGLYPDGRRPQPPPAGRGPAQQAVLLQAVLLPVQEISPAGLRRLRPLRPGLPGRHRPAQCRHVHPAGNHRDAKP